MLSEASIEEESSADEWQTENEFTQTEGSSSSSSQDGHDQLDFDALDESRIEMVDQTIDNDMLLPTIFETNNEVVDTMQMSKMSEFDGEQRNRQQNINDG